MKTTSTGPAQRVRRAILTLAAAAAVVVPASPAGAATVTAGRFTTLPAGEALGMHVDGVAVLNRSAGATTGQIVVVGLRPGVTYAAHLHNQPCSPNAGGTHYKNDPAGSSAPPNELWFSSTSDPTAGVTAISGGVAFGAASAPWVARPEARSVIIHAIPAGGTTAGGPKIACADL